MAFTSLLKYAKHRRGRQAPRSVRRALEFRDPSWLCPEVFAICSAIKLLFASMTLLKTTRGFSHALDLSTILWRSLCGQFIRARKLAAAAKLRQKLFRLAALTLQCAGLTTLESSSTSEPGRNTVLQASNGR